MRYRCLNSYNHRATQSKGTGDVEIGVCRTPAWIKRATDPTTFGTRHCNEHSLSIAPLPASKAGRPGRGDRRGQKVPNLRFANVTRRTNNQTRALERIDTCYESSNLCGPLRFCDVQVMVKYGATPPAPPIRHSRSVWSCPHQRSMLEQVNVGVGTPSELVASSQLRMAAAAHGSPNCVPEISAPHGIGFRV